jgi:O-antigen ligase
VGVYGALQYYGFLSARALAAKFVESGPWAYLYKFEKIAIGPLSHNHACLGAYMVVAVFVALFLSRTAWGVTKIVYLASVPFFMVVILWSQSRADFFGVFVGLVIYMVLSKVRPAAIIGFVGAVIATYILLNMVPELRERFLGAEQGSLVEYSAGRLVGWAKVLAYMFTRPIFWITGIGLGNFRWLYETNRVGLIAAHNNYFHWLTEGGVFGLCLPLIFLIKIGRIIKWLSFYGPFHREVSVSFLSLLLALCAVAATQELFTPNTALASAPAYIAFIMGYVVALYRTATIGSQFQEYQYASVESDVYE